MTILKIVLIFIGLILIGYFYPKSKKKMEEMNLLRTRTIEELKSIFKTSTKSYREMVEVKCSASGENLVIAPYSNRQVVYYDCDVYREEEEIDNDGHRRTTSRHIHSDYYRGNIQVSDSSTEETILIDINTSKLNIPITYEKFEPKSGFNASIGGLNISLGDFNNDYGVTGYKIKERTIDVGQNLYIIGEAYSDGKDIHIGKPADNKKSFIVTTKSEEDMLKSLKTTSIFQMIAGIALIVIGAFLLFN